MRLSSHVAKIVIGDFNAKVGNVHPGEEHVVGQFLCRNQHSLITVSLNIAIETLSNRQHAAMSKRPWISSATLNLIDARNNARLNYDYAHEVILNKKIKQSASKERSNVLNALMKSGAWEELKALRAKPQRRYGRLRD